MTKEEFLDSIGVHYEKKYILTKDIVSPKTNFPKGEIMGNIKMCMVGIVSEEDYNKYKDWFEEKWLYYPITSSAGTKFFIWATGRYDFEYFLDQDKFEETFNIYVEQLLKENGYATEERKIQEDNQQEH